MKLQKSLASICVVAFLAQSVAFAQEAHPSAVSMQPAKTFVLEAQDSAADRNDQMALLNPVEASEQKGGLWWIVAIAIVGQFAKLAVACREKPGRGCR